MIIEDYKDVEFDSRAEKARGLLVDDDKKILLAVINGSLQFPGGTVEDGEDYHETIIRELDEEVGLTLTDLEEVGTINYFHKNFPCLKNGRISNRINKVHYFYKNITNEAFHETNYTDFEKKNHMEIRKFSEEELNEELSKECANKYKEFMALEVRTAIELLKEKGLF